MNNKLLNQLIDIIDLIDTSAFQSGEAEDFKQFVKFDKQLTKHKTKAFKIIEKLRGNYE